jgi:hypothetical protein
MRKFGLLLLFIIILLAISPYLSGMLFKSYYLKLIDSTTHGKAQIVEYNEGWLSSDAKFYIALPGSTSDSKAKNFMPTGITVIQHITHGPYLTNVLTGTKQFAEAVIHSDVHLDTKTEEALIGANATDGIMQVDTVVSFLNNYTSQVGSPVFMVKVPPAGKISWQGISGNSSADFTGNYINHFVSNATLGALIADNNGISFASQPAKLDADFTCNAQFLCAGKENLNIPQVSTTDQQGQTSKITGFSFAMNSDNADGNYSNTIQINLNNIAAADYSVGPASIKISYLNLDANELSNLIEKMKSIHGEYSDMHSRQLAVAAELNASLVKLVTPQTQITELIKVTTPSGNFTSTGKVFWPPNTPLPASSIEMAMKITAQMNMRASVALVDEIIKDMDAKKSAEISAAPSPIVAPAALDYEAALPAFNEFQNEINTLVVQKQISPQIQTIIFTLLKAHTSPTAFNNTINLWLKNRQILLAPAKLVMSDYAIFYAADQKNILTIIFSKPAANLAELKAKINALMQINLISATTGGQLLDLQSQSLAPEIYAIALHKFAMNDLISPELESQLKAQYGVINHDLSLNADVGMSPTVHPVTAAPAVKGPLGTQFDDLVRKGYIVLDKEDYVISIDYRNGVLQISGQPFTGFAGNAASDVHH